MTANASYRYAENHGAGHHSRHRSTSPFETLARYNITEPKPAQWDHVSNFKGKNVWGVFQGERQQIYIIGLAPEGIEGERWYGMPTKGARCSTFSIPKVNLELAPKPVPVMALAIRPQMAVVVYKGAQ